MDYDQGQEVEVTGTFKRRVNGVLTLATPDDPTLRWKTPAGTTVQKDVGDLTEVSTGVYRYLLTADEAGKWGIEWSCSAPFVSVQEDAFWVRRSRV